MGEVYKARDLRLGRHVAVKTLPQAAASDHSAADRFDREARLIASLTSPLPGCWRRRQHGQSAGSLGEFGAQPARELDRFSTLVSIRSWLSDWKPHRSLVMTGGVITSGPIGSLPIRRGGRGADRPGQPGARE
jgi:serine/threonine protein kinase